MNMLAEEYITRYVHSDYRAYAKVVVSYALRGIHVPLKSDQPVPDNDDRNVTVFIQMDTAAMPPVLVRDHNCNETGFVCQDHPDQPAGHNGCYGLPLVCPYPTCPVNVPVAHPEGEYLGAGS